MDLSFESQVFSPQISVIFDLHKDVPLNILPFLKRDLAQYLSSDFPLFSDNQISLSHYVFDSESYSRIEFVIDANYFGFRFDVFSHAIRFYVCPFLIGRVSYYETKFPEIRQSYTNEEIFS